MKGRDLQNCTRHVYPSFLLTAQEVLAFYVLMGELTLVQLHVCFVAPTMLMEAATKVVLTIS